MIVRKKRLRLALVGLALVGCAARAWGQVDEVGGDLNPFRACGLNCLYVIARDYQCSDSLESLRSVLHPNEDGESSVADIERAAASVGLFTVPVRADMAALPELPLSAIVHLRSRSPNSTASHYVVLLALHRQGVMTIDAPTGTIIHPFDEFARDWSGAAILFDTDRGRRDELVSRYAALPDRSFWQRGVAIVTALALGLLLLFRVSRRRFGRASHHP